MTLIMPSQVVFQMNISLAQQDVNLASKFVMLSFSYHIPEMLYSEK